MVLYYHIVYPFKQLNNYKMKRIIFALCLIISIVMIGVSFAYANATMLVGALLSTIASWLLLWNEIKNNIKI